MTGYCQSWLLALEAVNLAFAIGCNLQVQLIKTAWPSGQRVGLAIRRSRVRVPLWPLAGFVLSHPEFKSSATLVNNQLVASCQLGF